jgi:hypothetical protein
MSRTERLVVKWISKQRLIQLAEIRERQTLRIATIFDFASLTCSPVPKRRMELSRMSVTGLSDVWTEHDMVRR